MTVAAMDCNFCLFTATTQPAWSWVAGQLPTPGCLSLHRMQLLSPVQPDGTSSLLNKSDHQPFQLPFWNWLNAHDSMLLGINYVAQCCAIRHQYSCASCINNLSLNTVRHACINNGSAWLTICLLHQNYGSVLCTMAQCCASGINMHAWLNAMHHGINYSSVLCAMASIIVQCCMCIRHQCAWLSSCINMARCCASTAQWCASGISMF